MEPITERIDCILWDVELGYAEWTALTAHAYLVAEGHEYEEGGDG